MSRAASTAPSRRRRSRAEARRRRRRRRRRRASSPARAHQHTLHYQQHQHSASESFFTAAVFLSHAQYTHVNVQRTRCAQQRPFLVPHAAAWTQLHNTQHAHPQPTKPAPCGKRSSALSAHKHQHNERAAAAAAAAAAARLLTAAETAQHSLQHITYFSRFIFFLLTAEAADASRVYMSTSTLRGSLCLFSCTHVRRACASLQWPYTPPGVTPPPPTRARYLI